MDSLPLLELNNQAVGGYLPNTGVVRRIDFEGVSEDETVRVFLRVKPISTENINDEINTKHYKLNGNSFTSITSNGKTEIHNEYFFNGVLSPTATQTEVFDIIVRPRLEEVLQGADTLLFSYGTTGSGKSFTIQGKGSEPGIIPRVLFVIFASIGNNQDIDGTLYPTNSSDVVVLKKQSVLKLQKEKHNLLECSNKILLQLASKSLNDGNDTIRATSCSEMEETLIHVKPLYLEKEDCLYSVWLSFIEVYNENIYDLFVKPESKVTLKIAFDKEKKIFVKGVTYMCISSWEEAYQLYLFGKHNLHVSPTSQNKNSSRSHCILTIKIIKKPKQNDGSYFFVSSFTICDLAGAERQKKTKTCGARLKESQNINTSLLVLNRCFNIIRTNQARKDSDYQMVPFRESKLTLLFQHALLGNAGITMITNVSQSDELTSETYQVLRSTAVAMKIKAKPFIRKTLPRRRSKFVDYCRERHEEAYPTTTSDFEEGSGSCLSCNNCVEFKKEIEQLQLTLEQKDITLYEEKEKCSKREGELKIDLIKKFEKILEENDASNRQRIENMKRDHHKQIEDTKNVLKQYYEAKLKERSSECCLGSCSMQQKKSVEVSQNQELFNIREKLVKLGDLFGLDYLPTGSDLNALEILERIIDIKSKSSDKEVEQVNTQASPSIDYHELEVLITELKMKNRQLEEALSLKKGQAEEMCRIQGEFTQLQKKVKSIGEVYGIDCSSSDDNQLNEINILDKVTEVHMKTTAKLLEQENILSRGVTDYTELEGHVKKLELKMNRLEEELALKDYKIEVLTGDINNLAALLAAKTNSESLPDETDAAAVAMGKLTLEDGTEEPIVIEQPESVAKKTTRRRTRIKQLSQQSSDKNSDTDGDDPSFFLPVQAATTGKKKKKKTKRINQEEIPLFSYSKQIAEGDVSLSTTSRTRRKLFRKGSDHIGDEEQLIQVLDPELSQQSPQSFIKSLRSRKVL